MLHCKSEYPISSKAFAFIDPLSAAFRLALLGYVVASSPQCGEK